MRTNLTPKVAQEAINKRDLLLQDGNLSNPSSEQKVAVVTSLMDNLGFTSLHEARVMKRERHAILDKLKSRGIDVVDVDAPFATDMDAVLTDPSITDLCLIGEGSVGSFYVRAIGSFGVLGAHYDWKDVSRATTHLKTGSIFQRMCSVRGLSPVPWGTFAAEDLTKIWISEEPYFMPDGVHDEPNQGLMTIYDANAISYQSMQDLAGSLKVR